MLIESIRSPADIKGFDAAQLTELAAEIRSGLWKEFLDRYALHLASGKFLP